MRHRGRGRDLLVIFGNKADCTRPKLSPGSGATGCPAPA